MKMKRCPSCGRALPLTRFGRDARSTDGRQWECLTCRRERWREAHTTVERMLRYMTSLELRAELDRRTDLPPDLTPADAERLAAEVEAAAAEAFVAP